MTHPAHWNCDTHGTFDAMVAVGCPTCVAELRADVVRLEQRRDELLATIARISQTVPLESEVNEALDQRGALLAEIGTLRARLRVVEAVRDDAREASARDLEARRYSDDTIREAYASFGDGTANDAIGRHLCMIALGERCIAWAGPSERRYPTRAEREEALERLQVRLRR